MKITFVNRNKINLYEANYWRRMVLSNLKIGVEIESNIESNRSRGDIMREMENEFLPTGSPYVFGKTGVCEVKTDGSLNNGIEMTTVGRKVNFIDMFVQYKVLCDSFLRNGSVMNSRCGLHNHILMDYGREHDNLEKPFNETIFKNFIQLVKKHYAELCFITSTVKHETSLTRFKYFCLQDLYLTTNLVIKNLVELKSIFNNKYNGVNFTRFRTTADGEIKNFHLELRFPDGSLYPAQIAGQNVLYGALLLKAIDLSLSGTIGMSDEALDDSSWTHRKELINSFRNNEDNDNRLSIYDTSIQSELIEKSNELVDWLKNEINVFDGRAFIVLKTLATTPVSILRKTMEDNEVNTYLDGTFKHTMDLKIPSELYETITTEEIKTNSRKEWCTKVGEKLSLKSIEIDSLITRLNCLKKVDYDHVKQCVAWI